MEPRSLEPVTSLAGLQAGGACGRCGGMMMNENLEDASMAGIVVLALHCVICGDIIDDVIVRHRAGLQPT